MTHPLRLCAAVFAGSLVLVAFGCTHDESTTSIQDDQAHALKDPYGYGPSPSSFTKTPEADQLDRTNISGGGINNLDKKALQRDLDSVFGP